MTASKPHSTRQDVLALRNALTILNRELATPTASSLANEGYAALGRLEEQFGALHEAATKAWALLPVDHQAHEILRDALLRVSNPATELGASSPRSNSEGGSVGASNPASGPDA